MGGKFFLIYVGFLWDCNLWVLNWFGENWLRGVLCG